MPSQVLKKNLEKSQEKAKILENKMFDLKINILTLVILI